MLLNACAVPAGTASEGNPNALVVVADGGPIEGSCPLSCSLCVETRFSEELLTIGVRSSFACAAAAFSSFFFSRKALPPWRRSKPETDFEKAFGPGESGANE